MMRNTRGWIVTSAATGINLILGVLYIWSIMGKALINEYNWTATQASLPYTVCIVMFALVMIFAGRVQDVKGPRLSSTFGGILLGGGLILSGFVKEPFLMTLTFGILGGAGIGFCYAATTPPAVKWFPLEKKGLISGIVVSGVGFAAVYISPLTNMLIMNFGVAKTFLFIGIAALIILIVLSQLLIDPPAGHLEQMKQKVQKNGGKIFEHKKQFGWREMLKTLSFYNLWVMYAFTSSAGLMIIGHLTVIAKNQAQWEHGFYLVVFLAVFNTLGRIVAGIVADKFGHIKTMRIIFSVQAVNMILFSLYTSPLLLAIGAALTGASYGALFSVFPVAIADYYGTKNLGVNYGLLFTSWGFGGVIGPLLAGGIFDATGSYNISYVVSAVLLIIACLLTFVIRSPFKK
ncbi:MAG TPA: OFA family MFS transporter [Clostridiaceae bacterium]|nr:OFA family MFS transporter [Clostridiaceae bacterium]